MNDLENYLYFKNIWNLNNDKILVCNQCELRNLCCDNRLPIQQNNQNWIKPECSYNPYISKWKGEEGYKTLAECGVISNENSFSIDHDKIAEINKELWGE